VTSWRENYLVKKAVFIDRDDTIAKDVPYCSKPEDLKLFQGIGKSIKKLNDKGFLVIIITNQSGIARGFFNERTLEKIHEKMKKDIEKDGGHIDAIYYCPHHPNDKCECRKPGTKLIEEAANEYNISLKDSYVIGDRLHDIEMGKKMGCKTIYINNYNDQGISFNEAVEKILKKK